MSCTTHGTSAALCAARNGIGRLNSKFVFFGAAALTTAFYLRRLRRSGTASPLANPGNERLVRLSSPTLITPLVTDQAANRVCAQCGAQSDAKKGGWYQIRGAYFCRDCASAAARKSGAALAGIAREATGTLTPAELPVYWPRKSVSLKATLVQSGGVRDLPGYRVLTNGRPSGLSLMPELKTEAGQVKVADRWLVNYDRANKAVAGPFNSRATAQHAAEYLCNFDWTRDIDDFSPLEVANIKAILINFRHKNA